ncbi:hypothetical protein F5Y05DRAFT_148442 [Hypoxylon sp. FL0543]|nr:hypothetical protein F5Y05DRAFT_148442 [Hypoxylon sp. FL0543]
MADLQQPPSIKRKLPFKRTARRKSSEAAEDDGLALFSRSGEFFEEQQRRAQEKAEREKAEKAAREAKAEQERKERITRERKADEEALNRRAHSDKDPAKKRRLISLSDDDYGDEGSDEDDIFGSKPPKKQKSPSIPRTPTSKRESSSVDSTSGYGERLTRSQVRNATTSVISLDDDDNLVARGASKHTPSRPSNSRDRPKLDLRHESSSRKSKQDIVLLDDDSDLQTDAGEEPKEDEEEDPSEYYVRAAMERARKAQEEREAREKRGSSTAADDNDPVVQILIHSHMHGIHTLMFRRKLCQKLTVVYETWIEQQVSKHSLVPRPVLESMFFTWKGNKVYPHTTLRTLGIRPERDGSLYSDWKADRDGYHGRDKVYFEAWTQELYDEYLEEKEKKRLREIGELIEDEPEARQESEQPQDSQEDQKIRVHFKAKDRPATKATVRSSTTAAQLAAVYRRLANIPESKTIELRWDGEALDPDTTVEEAEIEDMDSIEVHIK